MERKKQNRKENTFKRVIAALECEDTERVSIKGWVIEEQGWAEDFYFVNMCEKIA